MKKLLKALKIGLFFSALILFFGPMSIASSRGAGQGNRCPDGNVKAEWKSGGWQYESGKNDGSATVGGNKRTVTWLPTSGFEVTGVCIKIGGKDSNLQYPDVSDQSWTTQKHDISHIVLTTRPVQQQEVMPSITVVEYCDGNVVVTINGNDTRRMWRVDGVEKWIDFNETETFSATDLNVAIEWKHNNAFKTVNEDFVTRTGASDCDNGEVDPTPTPQPTQSPEPTPTPEPTSTPDPKRGKKSRMGANVEVCRPSFQVTMDLLENGDGVKDKEVRFEFDGKEAKVKTNEDGRASANFNWGSNGTVKLLPQTDSLIRASWLNNQNVMRSESAERSWALLQTSPCPELKFLEPLL